MHGSVSITAVCVCMCLYAYVCLCVCFVQVYVKKIYARFGEGCSQVYSISICYQILICANGAKRLDISRNRPYMGGHLAFYLQLN